MLTELPSTRDGVRTFEYAFPRKISFCNARERECTINKNDAFEWLKQNRDIVRSVSFEDSPDGGVSLTARWLESACPYCGGKPQPMRHERWVYVPGWRYSDNLYPVYDETAKKVGFPENGVLPRTPSDRIPAEYFLVYDGEIPLAPRYRFETLQGNRSAPQPYGDALPADEALAELQQNRLQGPDFPPLFKRYGREGRFAGTYHCSYCGGYYSAVFGYFKEEWANLETMGSSGALSSSLPKDPVKIARTKDTLELVASISNVRVKFEFDFANGMTFVDDACVFRASPAGCFTRPALERPDFFERKDFLLQLMLLFPDEARPADELLQSHMKGVAVLAVANRFRNYPASFYDDIEKMLFDGNRAAANAVQELPIDYSEIGGLFWRTGLPNKKSLKRILFHRPLLLALVASCPLLPFKNIDIIARLFESERSVEYLTAFNSEQVARIWWLMSQAKEEATVLAFLERFPMSRLDSMVAPIAARMEFDGYHLTDASIERMRHRSIEEGLREMPFLLWESSNPGMSTLDEFTYSRRQRELENEVDGFEFSLAKGTRELVSAAIDLHNCLDDYCQQIPSRSLIVLIRHNDRFVGAIELQKGTIVQAHAIANMPLSHYPELEKVYLKWVDRMQISELVTNVLEHQER